jgi:hypothetical protein
MRILFATPEVSDFVQAGGTPQDLLREAGLAFSWVKLMAHGGMDAVGPNENIGLVEHFEALGLNPE